LIYKGNFRAVRWNLNQSLLFLNQFLHGLNQSLQKVIQSLRSLNPHGDSLIQLSSSPESESWDFGLKGGPMSRSGARYWALAPGVKGPGGDLVISAVTSSPAIANPKVSQKASI